MLSIEGSVSLIGENMAQAEGLTGRLVNLVAGSSASGDDGAMSVSSGLSTAGHGGATTVVSRRSSLPMT